MSRDYDFNKSVFGELHSKDVEEVAQMLRYNIMQIDHLLSGWSMSISLTRDLVDNSGVNWVSALIRWLEHILWEQ
jgi:hypothetical protein